MKIEVSQSQMLMETTSSTSTNSERPFLQPVYTSVPRTSISPSLNGPSGHLRSGHVAPATCYHTNGTRS